MDCGRLVGELSPQDLPCASCPDIQRALTHDEIHDVLPAYRPDACRAGTKLVWAMGIEVEEHAAPVATATCHALIRSSYPAGALRTLSRGTART